MERSISLFHALSTQNCFALFGSGNALKNLLRGIAATQIGTQAATAAQEVLQDINLEVQDGEFIIFVGPSGCGKSTLLRSIAGLEDVSSSQVLINGDDVTVTPPSKRGIAMVFQSYALYPHLTVKDNMGLGLKRAGTPKATSEAAFPRLRQCCRLTLV